jgi:hypothetical protein
LFIVRFICASQFIARIETWRWNVQVTLPPLAEHTESGSNAKPKGVPGIGGEKV